MGHSIEDLFNDCIKDTFNDKRGIYNLNKFLSNLATRSIMRKTFELAARVADVLIDEGLVDWVNLQCNGNWGLLHGRKLSFHVHIYGRKKDGKTWGQPVELPKLPNTYHNEPISGRDVQRLILKFHKALASK